MFSSFLLRPVIIFHRSAHHHKVRFLVRTLYSYNLVYIDKLSIHPHCDRFRHFYILPSDKDHHFCRINLHSILDNTNTWLYHFERRIHHYCSSNRMQFQFACNHLDQHHYHYNLVNKYTLADHFLQYM